MSLRNLVHHVPRTKTFLVASNYLSAVHFVSACIVTHLNYVCRTYHHLYRVCEASCGKCSLSSQACSATASLVSSLKIHQRRRLWLTASAFDDVTFPVTQKSREAQISLDLWLMIQQSREAPRPFTFLSPFLISDTKLYPNQAFMCINPVAIMGCPDWGC